MQRAEHRVELVCVFFCFTYDVTASWPDLTPSISLPKVAKGIPHKFCKVSAQSSLRTGSNLRNKSCWGCRGERGTSVHGADTFIAVYGKTIGCLCPRKCRSVPSLADYRSTKKITKCLQPHREKLRICALRAFLKLILKHYFS